MVRLLSAWDESWLVSCHPHSPPIGQGALWRLYPVTPQQRRPRDGQDKMQMRIEWDRLTGTSLNGTHKCIYTNIWACASFRSFLFCPPSPNIQPNKSKGWQQQRKKARKKHLTYTLYITADYKHRPIYVNSDKMKCVGLLVWLKWVAIGY